MTSDESLLRTIARPKHYNQAREQNFIFLISAYNLRLEDEIWYQPLWIQILSGI
jgi:hypothetical protein